MSGDASTTLTTTTAEWRRVASRARTLENSDVVKHLRELARPRQIAYAWLRYHTGGDPIGVEFRHTAGPRWAFVAPNVTSQWDQSPWRVQHFNESGFTLHTCHKDLQSAVEDMIGQGFHLLDPGVLDRLTISPRWAMGVEQSIQRDLFNQNRITLAQLVERLKEIEARHS